MGRSRLLAVGLAAAVAAPVAAPAAAQATGAVVVATGSVKHAQGEVRAYAWSTDRTGPAVRRMPLVATAYPDSRGRFRLRARRPALMHRLGQAKGSVDLIVLAPTRRGWAETVFSSRISQRGSGVFATAAASSGAQAAPSIELQTLEPGGARAANHTCEDWGDVGAPKETRTHTYKRSVIVGELNNAYPDTAASFTYGQRADSTVSSGIRLEGKGWGLEGSTDISNSLGGEIGPQELKGPYARRIRTKFYFGRYEIGVCAAPNTGSHYWRTKALSWAGGSTSRR